jgi:hypothetical protein
VIVKLCLIVSVIVVGATVLRPVLDADASLDNPSLIAGASWDVAALATAATLGPISLHLGH